MKKYYVTMPIVGTATVCVEAENKEAAIEAAFDSAELTRDSIDEWEALTRGCRGSGCALSYSHAYAEEVNE